MLWWVLAHHDNNVLALNLWFVFIFCLVCFLSLCMFVFPQFHFCGVFPTFLFESLKFQHRFFFFYCSLFILICLLDHLILSPQCCSLLALPAEDWGAVGCILWRRNPEDRLEGSRSRTSPQDIFFPRLFAQ